MPVNGAGGGVPDLSVSEMALAEKRHEIACHYRRLPISLTDMGSVAEDRGWPEPRGLPGLGPSRRPTQDATNDLSGVAGFRLSSGPDAGRCKNAEEKRTKKHAGQRCGWRCASPAVLRTR